MPQIQYPFIDIAVHPAIRGKFAAGEAIALFSRDMMQVLWSNGEGAKLFGYSDIYDLLDDGPDRSGVAFRQLAATARQLETIGDRRGLMMRISTGFSSQAVPAEVSLVEIRRGETVVTFSAPVAANATFNAKIASMLKGFDDPDTHMAVIDDQGALLAASPGFDALGILPETARTLIAAVAKSGEGLIKRPIASAAGYLPAAIGKLSIDPPLNLLFCVETVLGRMDPPQETTEPRAVLAAEALAQSTAPKDDVEEDVSLPGINEENDLPVEGMIETLSEPEAEFASLLVREHSSAEEARAVEHAASGSLELAADQADAAAVPDVGGQEDEPEQPFQALEETPAIDPQGEGVSTEEVSENLELAADRADAATVSDAGRQEDEPEQPFQPLEETSAIDQESDDVSTVAEEPENLSATTETPENLELAADQAEMASVRESTTTDISVEALPHRSELAADEMESQVDPEDEVISEPEDHAEAEMAEAVLNEGESIEDIADLADLDGATTEEVEAHSSDEDTSLDAELPAENAEADSADVAEPQTEGTIETATETPSEPAVEPTVIDNASDTGADTRSATDAQAEIAAAGDETPADAQPASGDTVFTFRRDGRSVRFVWKLDAQGRFSEVSEEFARTVGPRAGNINGMSYRDLDSLFNLDPGNEIGLLLERRDTWSGRTIRWPVEGTDLVVPVDLAALPTYSRNREFDGFRGFGIIRIADAEQDPHAIGLTLAATDEAQPETATAAGEAVETIADTSGSDEVPLTIDGQFEETDAQEPPVVAFSEPETIVSSEEVKEPADEFRGEVPALKLGAETLTSFSEKIIQLEERRARNRDGLTPNEQNAFREIARQLEPFGKRPNDTLPDRQGDAAAQPSAALEGIDAAGDTSPQAAEDTEVKALHDDAIVDEVGENTADELPAAETTADDAGEENVDVELGLTASAADQIPLAILIHAGDRLIHANSEFRRLTGYETLEALEAAGGLDALITRREGPDGGVFAIRADGAQLPVSARLQSVRYERAKLLMLTLTPAEAPPSDKDGLAEDQEAARKLSALKVEAEELRSILETATDGVVVLDIDGRIRSMNRSASALFNFEDAETRGKPFAMLFAHESQKAVQDYLNGLSGHGVASVLNDGREVIGREASGGFIPLFMTMGRMPGSNSYCAVIRDITQWKRSEEELKTAKRSAETANQHKSDFLARVSHEIRTPLNAIIGFSDMIASEHFGPAGHPRYVEYANDIGRSGRHVLDIVNDLLDISKIEAGEMDLEFTAVGLNDCVSEAVTLVQPQANTQRVIIRTSLSQSVPDVVADLRSIKQIAINILANAIRFTPSGGQIVVSTAYEPNGSVTLRIRDTGVGMSKADLEQAMKPFGQVSPGARHRGDGTGLGLPLTRAMTEANRAMFSIQSAPNEGTLVEITFPPQRVLAD